MNVTGPVIAAIYARKSTSQAGVAEEEKSVTRQVEQGKAYASRKGWIVDERYIFVDDGISGAEFVKRPGLGRLRDLLTPRAPFQRLIMSEESRLGREQIQTAYILKCILDADVQVFYYYEDRERTLRSFYDSGVTMMGIVELLEDDILLVSVNRATRELYDSRADEIVGRKVSEACAPAFKHCHLEMGGKNIIMVMDDARLDLAVDGAVWGGFGTTGQRCTAASRVAVHKNVYKEFAARFVERTKALRVGNGLDPGVDMGPCISESQRRTVEKYVQIAKGEGAKLLTGAHRLEGGAWAHGFFHEPTIFGDCSPSMRISREEVFGPVVAVIPIGSLEEAIEVGNSVEYGLSASIYTQDINKAFTAMREMYTGIFYVNAPTIGAETHLPFGGTKHTGNGHREACVQALEVFGEWESIYIDYSGHLQRAQIDTGE